MIFQTFDDKKDCIAVYAKGQMHRKKHPDGMSKTWNYTEFLRDDDIQYAKYYCEGKSLGEACPEHLQSEWNEVSHKLEAIYRSVKEADLNLNDHCFFDMLSDHFLIEYGHIKNKICKHVFKNCEKPANYDFIVDLVKVLTEIKNRKLNIDLSDLKSRRHQFKVRQFIKRIKKTSPYIIYDAYGTKTGRLTGKSFPILTMDKSYRKILKPNNEWFLEFDFNAAELRVMLGLLGKEQPEEDLHEWNLDNIYRGIGDRESAKKRIFAWLYNPQSKDHLSNRFYDRDALLKKYWDGTHIKTCFDRTIEAPERTAVNYLVQSTAADLFLRQMIKVWEMLKNKKSYIAFCLHDSLVIDLAQEDEFVINDLKEEFANTQFGAFKVNSFGGKNFGEMKRMNLN